eukprot:7380052-Prymnesium_polylepis.1
MLHGGRLVDAGEQRSARATWTGRKGATAGGGDSRLTLVCVACTWRASRSPMRPLHNPVWQPCHDT